MFNKKKIEEKKRAVHQLKIVVQSENRLAAIGSLSRAIESLAKALTIQTAITVRDCQFESTPGGVGMEIATGETEVKTINIDQIFGE